MNNPFEPILARLSNIETLLLDIKHNPKEQDERLETDHWFDLNGLVLYDPERRTKPTFYGYVSKRIIPFHKRGGKIIFLKSEIDTWLKEGRNKTIAETAKEADEYLKKSKLR